MIQNKQEQKTISNHSEDSELEKAKALLKKDLMRDTFAHMYCGKFYSELTDEEFIKIYNIVYRSKITSTPSKSEVKDSKEESMREKTAIYLLTRIKNQDYKPDRNIKEQVDAFLNNHKQS